MSELEPHVFRADFNETTASVEECTELVEDAVEHSFGLHFGENVRTGTIDHGQLQNVWVRFEVFVDDVPEEDRTVKGRLLERLGGSDVRLNEIDG